MRKLIGPPIAWCVAALLVAIPASVTAQAAASARLAVGVPLRLVRNTGQSETALYAGESAAALQTRYDCGAGCDHVFATAWNDLFLVEARVQHGHSAQRALLGGLIGGAGTWAALIGTAEVLAHTGAMTCHWDRGSCPSFAIAMASPFIVIAGSAIGATIGWEHQGESWERVWPRP